MRILRLYMPQTEKERPFFFVGSKDGKTFADGERTAIICERAGEKKETENNSLRVVLPKEAVFEAGDFLRTKGGVLMRKEEKGDECSVLKNGYIGVFEKVEIQRPIRTAVLTISDKGSRGEREDTSGPALCAAALLSGCVAEERKMVPDDENAICDAVRQWAEKGINLILTTGGTGLSPRDRTPEALMSIADRTVPGFGEMMRYRTSQNTLRSYLSRSVAVTLKSALIIAFPGSARASVECFNAIEPCLRHGVETLTAEAVECGSDKRN